MTMDRPAGQKSNGAAKHGPSDHRPAASAAEAVDVLVEIFVGDTPMTLADLNRLRKGDVLPLGASLADPVEIRVKGRCIGHGELVAVDDQFGVRITDIA